MFKGKLVKFFSGEFCIILCAVLWGCISIFTLPLQEKGFSSIDITFVRSLLSAVVIGLFILIKDKSLFKISLRDIPLMIFLGIGCFMTVCLLYTLSIEENGSSAAAMLMYTSPIWAVVMSRFIFKEKITGIKLISLAGVVGGCAMLSFGGETVLSVKGILIGLTTGVSLALYGIFNKISDKKYSAETTIFYVFLFSTVGSFFISSAWNFPAKVIANPSSIPYFIGLSVLSTAIAYLFYSIGLKTVSAGKASMLSALEIVVATIVGIVVYSINAGILGYIGIAVTLFSLILLEIGDTMHAKKHGYEKNSKCNCQL